MWLFETDTVERFAWMEAVFTPEECNTIIEIGLDKERKAATIFGTDLTKGDVDDSIRKNKVSWLEPEDDLEWAYRRLTDATTYLNTKYFKFELFGFTEKIQFTEYSNLQDRYKQHVDKVFNANIRKLSLSVQLSDPKDYKGCELHIIDGPTPEVMRKDQGSLIVFPSYALHEVTPLTEGTRYSLVAWIGGHPFK
jgi:PKHD-type hydroxylase